MQQWPVEKTAPYPLWSRKDFHQCLKIAERSKETLTGTSSVVQHWERLQLRPECTFPPNKPRAPYFRSLRTTQWKNSGFKLNKITRCSRFKTFNLVVTATCRTENGGLADQWYIDDDDILCHPTLVLSYEQAFDTANVKIGAERATQKTEDIYYFPNLDAAPPEWRVNDVCLLASVSTAACGIWQTNFWRQTSFAPCMNVSSCVRTRRQNLPSSASVLASVESTTSSECTVTQFFKRQAANIFDEVGQRSLERLLPGFTEDGLEQATLSASQSGIG